MAINKTSPRGTGILLPLVLSAVLPSAGPARAQGFGPMAVYTTTASGGANQGPFDVKVADVNGDGFLDLITAETEAGVGVLLGLAGNLYAPATTYAVGPRTGINAGATHVVLGDVTGDGRLDIVATTLDDLVVLPGLSNGSFGPYVTYPIGLGVRPVRVALNDLNADGRLDIVTTNDVSNAGINPSQYAVGVLLARAGGGFMPAVTYPSIPNSTPNAVAVGDVTGDGRPDIVVTCYFPGVPEDVAILVGQAGGGFAAPMAYDCGRTVSSLWNVALADTNGDGRLDIIVNNVSDNVTQAQSVGVLLGLPGGAFGAPTAYAMGGGGLGLAVGDATNDGLPDIVVANTNTSCIGVLPGQAGGGFGPVATYSAGFTNNTTSGAGGRPYGVALADLNGDGRTDLISANAMTREVGVFLALAPPTLSGSSPASGGPGSVVALTGTGLVGTTLISFAGTANNTVSSGFVVNAAGTQITGVQVPAGAQTGPVTVRNAAGTATTLGSFGVLTATAGTAVALSNPALFPNPAHGRATVQVPGGASATLTVLDALGRALRTQAVAADAPAELDLTGLAPGLYTLRVVAGPHTTTRRLAVE
jgi:hypothetical protein